MQTCDDAECTDMEMLKAVVLLSAKVWRCSEHKQQRRLAQDRQTGRQYLEEDSGHRVECLLWPWLKPVYDSVVDQAREVAAACAEGLTHRRHCQHHMQVVAALQHKLCPAGFLAVICTLLHSLQQTSRWLEQSVSLYCQV